MRLFPKDKPLNSEEEVVKELATLLQVNLFSYHYSCRDSIIVAVDENQLVVEHDLIGAILFDLVSIVDDTRFKVAASPLVDTLQDNYVPFVQEG